MYIHLGGDTVVPDDAIIGVFDLDTASVGARTREFLRKMQQQGRVREVSGELPRSFTVVLEPDGTTVYLSQLSSAALNRRATL